MYEYYYYYYVMKLTAVSFKILYVPGDDSMMLLILAFENIIYIDMALERPPIYVAI